MALCLCQRVCGGVGEWLGVCVCVRGTCDNLVFQFSLDNRTKDAVLTRWLKLQTNFL